METYIMHAYKKNLVARPVPPDQWIQLKGIRKIRDIGKG